jgi:hypothetical protein
MRKRLVENGIPFPNATVEILSDVACGKEREERPIMLQVQEMESKRGQQRIGVQRHTAGHNNRRPSRPPIADAAVDTPHRGTRSNFSHRKFGFKYPCYITLNSSSDITTYTFLAFLSSSALPPTTDSSSTANLTRVGDLDLSTIGIEFVLRFVDLFPSHSNRHHHHVFSTQLTVSQQSRKPLLPTHVRHHRNAYNRPCALLQRNGASPPSASCSHSSKVGR